MDSNITLSLLVIDLQTSCVVKVERGDDSTLAMEGWGTQKLSTGSVSIEEIPFAEVRDAIDSQERPVPRIERRDTNSTVDGMPVYLIRQDKDVANDGTALSTSVYDALTALNGGKPLPIWSGGTWEQLPTPEADERTATCDFSFGFNAAKDQLPIKVWRYTRS